MDYRRRKDSLQVRRLTSLRLRKPQFTGWQVYRFIPGRQADELPSPVILLTCKLVDLLISKLLLKRRRNRQAEGLSGLPEDVPRAVGLHGLLEAVIACAARREHCPGNQLRRAASLPSAHQHVIAKRRLVKTHRIVCVVETERRVDDRHNDRKLAAQGHTRNYVGTGDGPDVAQEAYL